MFTRRTPTLLMALTLTALTGLSLTAKPAQAQTVFTSRSSFDAAAPGLTDETFQEATVPDGAGQLLTGPLSSTTTTAPFATGLTASGLTLTATGSTQPGLLAVLGNGTIIGTSKSVGNNHYSDTLNLTFGPAVQAVGFDLYGAAGPGRIASYSILVDVFGSSGLLTSQAVTGSGSPSFFGIIDTATPITSISLSVPAANESSFVDNVEFGTPAAVTTTPEPASYAAFAMGGIGLLGLTLKARKRKA